MPNVTVLGEQQKVCVGDDTGAVTCFEMKRGAFNVRP